MPTEHKRSITSPTSATNVKDNNVIIPRLQEQHQQYPSKQQLQELTQLSIEEREQQHRPHNNSNLNLTMEIDNMSTSQTSTTSSNGSCNGSKKTVRRNLNLVYRGKPFTDLRLFFFFQRTFLS